MKIAVNTRLLLTNKLEGFGWFANETLKRITQWHKEHEFIFIFDRAYDEQFIYSDNITPVVCFPQARHPVLWYLFFDWGVPRVLKKNKADMFLSPEGWLSLRTGISSLPVIHDLNFFHHPEWVEWFPRQYYNYFFPRFIKKAARIATVSQYSKKDISERFGIADNMIDVVYNGSHEQYRPLSPEEVTQVRKKFTEGFPYFLFVGLIHPRKNLTNILHAYNRFRQQQDTKVKFIVVGSTKYWTADTRDAYFGSPYKNDIIFLGRMEVNELHKIYGAATALVYASLFEGFGIPILEAMNCDTPVITSNVTSMPEVGGNSALYADPCSVQSIVDAMIRVYRDNSLRNTMIEKGRIQRSKFSWDKTAENLWSSIEKVLKIT